MKPGDEHIPNKRLHSAFFSQLCDCMIFLSYVFNMVGYIDYYLIVFVACLEQTLLGLISFIQKGL